MIKNIIFDVGNVLVKWDPKGYLRDRGYTQEDREVLLNAIFKSETWQLGNRGTLNTPEELTEGFLKEYEAQNPDHDAGQRAKYKELILDAYAGCEGTIHKTSYSAAWLSEMRSRGFKVFVLSNYPKDLYENTLEKLEFLEWMDGVVFSFEAKSNKPELDIYQTLLKRYDLDPGESIFIDDVGANVAAARSLGIHSVQFETYEQAKSRVDLLIELHDMDDRMVFCCE